MLLSAALLPMVVGIFTLVSGQELNDHHDNVTGILQQLEAQVRRLEMKIDNLTAIVNKVEPLPMDCEDVRKQRQEATIESGLFLLQAPGLLKRRVYCNFTEKETWTTISRRIHGKQIFNRTWNEYKNGFGKANSDYWIGNEMIYQLTTAGNYTLRITLIGYKRRETASYATFKLGNEASFYRLHLGAYDSENSTGGDSFFPKAPCNKNGHTDAPFSTYDRGNAKDCSKTLSGGWWFTDCGCSNLNGEYVRGESVLGDGPNIGIYWDTLYFNPLRLKSSLSKVIMEIKKIHVI